MNFVGRTHFMQRNPAEAGRIWREALAIAQHCGDRAVEALVLTWECFS
jgi:hypothetical protein